MTALATARTTPAVARLPSNAFAYEACDIAPGMTIDEYRRQRSRTRHTAPRPRLLAWVRSAKAEP